MGNGKHNSIRKRLQVPSPTPDWIDAEVINFLMTLHVQRKTRRDRLSVKHVPIVPLGSAHGLLCHFPVRKPAVIIKLVLMCIYIYIYMYTHMHALCNFYMLYKYKYY